MFLTHFITAVYMLLQLCVTRMPFRILHFWHTEAFGLVYMLFTVVHWLCDGDPLYDVLDYSDGPYIASTMVVGLLTMGIPFMQLLLFLVYWLRLAIVEVMKDESIPFCMFHEINV